MADLTPWQRVAQTAEHLTKAIEQVAEATGYPPEQFSVEMGAEARRIMQVSALGPVLPAPLLALADMSAEDWERIKAAHGSTAYMWEPMAYSRSFHGSFPWQIVWLRRPKSKRKRQWKKWQRLHAGKYCRALDLPQIMPWQREAMDVITDPQVTRVGWMFKRI